MDHTLVIVFLRGAMDGLSYLVPHADPSYRTARPTLAVPSDRVIELDATFGWHPATAPLGDLWTAGRVAMVPASGSTDPSRSHFAAQARMEAGVGSGQTAPDGWLGRYVAAGGDPGPFGAVSIGRLVAASLRGHHGSVALADLADLSLGGRRSVPLPVDAAFRTMVDPADTPPAAAGRGVFDMIDELAGRGLNGTPAPADYPAVPIGHDLWQAAQLITSGIPLGAIALSHGGWDHHDGLGTVDGGRMTSRLDELCRSIAAFWTSIDGHGSEVTMIVMTEFGRRVAENSNGGTDHGHGSVMTIIGEGVTGGIHGAWPGLAPAALDNGDVAVATDHLAVLAEVVDRRCGLGDRVSDVLSGWDGSADDYVGVAT